MDDDDTMTTTTTGPDRTPRCESCGGAQYYSTANRTWLVLHKATCTRHRGAR
jgi:hypothetical protein